MDRHLAWCLIYKHSAYITTVNKAFIDIRLRPGIATPPEEDRATVDLHNKFREDRSSGSRDRQTDTQRDRQIDRNSPLPYRGGVIDVTYCF